MLSSLSLKAAVLGLAMIAPIMLGGCDRQSGGDKQPGAQQADAAAGIVAKGTSAAQLDRSKQGSDLPAIVVADQAGQKLDLASLRGKPVLINLWATWCAPCVIELPTLAKLANRADLNLAVVTVSQDMSKTENVQPFLDQRGLARLPAWLDPEGSLAAHYGVQTLPATILYDAAGKEVWRYAGERDWGSAASLAILAEGGARP